MTDRPTASHYPGGIPDGITKEDVRAALADLDAGEVDYGFGPSTDFDLVFEGRRYPPKAVIGLAARRIAQRPLKKNEFSGGKTSRCFRILRVLGFEIEGKGFSERSFELLGELHRDPTLDAHNRLSWELSQHLRTPLKALMQRVAEQCRPEIRETLETKKHVVSLIHNRAGYAYDYIWAAFYPRDVKRMHSAQLFVVVERGEVRYGFGFGTGADAAIERFCARLATKKESVRVGLQSGLDDRFVFHTADDDPVGSLDEWLESVEPSHPGIKVVESRESVLEASSADLASRIAGVFNTLYPLVLMSLEGLQVSAVEDYVGADESDEAEDEYTIADFVEETGFEAADVEQWLAALDRKKQAVLYGPPGTGKTFVAQRLARLLTDGNDDRTDTVQFHPAYSYEDFMQGLRPVRTVEGNLEYKAVGGRFVKFCNKAASRDFGTSVLVIDEINRANLSRVFGELMFLLEYRDQSIPLAVDGTPFSIPENVRIIATMNTADRSIALVDHALRRRFAFIGLYPRYELLHRYHERVESGFDAGPLASLLERVNAAIGDPNYSVGVSFFMREEIEREIESIWRTEVEPYLEEYFFDRAEAREAFRWDAIRGQLT